MKIVFFGTSKIAADFLNSIISDHEITLAITVEPGPAGRGWLRKPSAVAEFCRKNNIPVISLERFSGEIVSKISRIRADLGVVVDFGKLIPEKIFKLPKYRTVNVHFSLLPRWRGCAPVQWALLSGDRETGVSIFFLEKSLDTGPVIAQVSQPISDDDDALTLENKLLESGKKLLLKSMENICSGSVKTTTQSGEPTYAPALTKEQGLINWNKSAGEIHNQVRAFARWPQAYTFYPTKNGRKILKIIQSEKLPICPGYDDCCPLKPTPGTITGVASGTGFVVRCGEDFLLVKKVLPQDKKVMSAADFWSGARLKVTAKLGD
jgi:methionyl-tRNA formyltransferase